MSCINTLGQNNERGDQVSKRIKYLSKFDLDHRLQENIGDLNHSLSSTHHLQLLCQI